MTPATLGEARIPARPIALTNILWATDFSSVSMRGLRYVLALATRSGSKVYLAHVVVSLPREAVPPESLPYLHDLCLSAEERLEKLSQSEAFRKIPHEVIVTRGGIADELNRIARSKGIDLVIVATHGLRGVGHYLVGSVSEQIWCGAACPVMAIGPAVLKSASGEFGLRHVLHLSDLSGYSLAAARYAWYFSLMHSAHMTILHVRPGGFGVSAEHLAEALREEAHSAFPSGLSQRNEPEIRIESGVAADAVLRIAKEKSSDLIVMGLYEGAQTKIGRARDYAYRVVAESECPVLTVGGAAQPCHREAAGAR